VRVERGIVSSEGTYGSCSLRNATPPLFRPLVHPRQFLALSQAWFYGNFRFDRSPGKVLENMCGPQHGGSLDNQSEPVSLPKAFLEDVRAIKHAHGSNFNRSLKTSSLVRLWVYTFRSFFLA
jgi:hypothetical protein